MDMFHDRRYIFCPRPTSHYGYELLTLRYRAWNESDDSGRDESFQSRKFDWILCSYGLDGDERI